MTGAEDGQQHLRGTTPHQVGSSSRKRKEVLDDVADISGQEHTDWCSSTHDVSEPEEATRNQPRERKEDAALRANCRAAHVPRTSLIEKSAGCCESKQPENIKKDLARFIFEIVDQLQLMFGCLPLSDEVVEGHIRSLDEQLGVKPGDDVATLYSRIRESSSFKAVEADIRAALKLPAATEDASCRSSSPNTLDPASMGVSMRDPRQIVRDAWQDHKKPNRMYSPVLQVASAQSLSIMRRLAAFREVGDTMHAERLERLFNEAATQSSSNLHMNSTSRGTDD